ncbi:S-layer homology domain-containing protein [Alteribacillus iranensis]|uniref:S-layer homology domain-containing protein n=1 Tax=Alteribacillus iranensis TaxID=930128 RepID=A0A1I2BW16_9BACI|nr:S-layer homology domain-containing protein [Alteribacillus iranensis]SFE60281.1 S-layer homology domain-containing protein [Alteribacillus iranensis]
MAYQPKSYRKFLATSLSAAVVASAGVAAVQTQEAQGAEQFSDVNDAYWASEYIERLASQGIINGYPDGTYRPGNEIVRGQVAELLVRAFDLPLDTDAEAPFEDLNDDSYYTPYAAAVKEAGLIQGREDNTVFAGSRDLTRAQMATILVRAFDLEPLEGVEADVADLEDAHESHRDNIEILAQHNITSTADGMFRPKETVTRAQFAAFLDRAMSIEEPTDIAEVNALTDDGHVLEVQFTTPYRGEIDRSQVRVFETSSGERKGVERVELSSDGLTAEVHLFDNTSENAEDEVPRLVEHTIQIGDLEHNFTRPDFIQHRVVEIDIADSEFTILTDDGNTETITVPEEFEDFNYQRLLGEEVSVWFDENNDLIDYSIEDPTADYDAIEITEDDEIELLTTGEDLDISDDQFDNVDEDEFRFYVDGEEENIENYVDRKFNFAKVGYDDSGDVAYISAYNLSNFLVVDRVEDNEVIGYEGEGTGGAFDAKDATIVKDGEVIDLDDLEEGDVLFFNADANGDDGFAEVYNNEVQGEIDTVYSDSIRVDGEVYDFNYDSADIEDFQVDYEGGAVYLNDEGETEYIDSDAAEELQAAGEVVLHLDRAGNLVYIDGDLADVESNTKPSVLTADVKFDSNFGNDLAQIEAVTSDDEERLFEIQLTNLDTITVNGVDYDIDDADDRDADEWDPTVDGDNIVLVSGDGEEVTIEAEYLAEGQLVQLHLDDDGDLEELEFFTANNTDEGTDVLADNEVLEPGDTYFHAVSGAKRINNNTVVFDATDGFDADDITVTTWDNYSGSDIDDATVIYDEDDEAIAIVINETTTSDVVYEEAVITQVLRNTDEEVVEVTAYVNGEEETYEVNDVNVDLAKGDVAVLEFDDNNDNLVEDIQVAGDSQYDSRIITGDVDEVNVGTREVTIDGTVYTLVSDGAVVDVSDSSDISEEALRDLRGEEDVTVVLDETSGRFAKFFVIGADVDGSDDDDEGDVTAPTVTLEDATATAGDTGVDVTYSVADVEETADVDFEITDEEGNAVGSVATETVEEDVTDATATITVEDGIAEGDYTITASVGDEEVTANLTVSGDDPVTSLNDYNEEAYQVFESDITGDWVVAVLRSELPEELADAENFELVLDGTTYSFTVSPLNEERFIIDTEVSASYSEDDILNAEFNAS